MPFFQALRGLISGHVFQPCRTCREQFEKTEAENSRLTAEKHQVHAENSRLKAENSSLIARIAALESTASRAANDALHNAYKTAGDKSTRIINLNFSVTALRGECSQKDERISTLENKLTVANKEHEALKMSVQRYKDQDESKEKKIQSLVLERDNARIVEAAAIQEAKKATEEKARAFQREREAVVAREEAATAQRKAITARDQMWSEYYDAQQTVEDLRRQVQELQATNLSAQSTSSSAPTVTPPNSEVSIVQTPTHLPASTITSPRPEVSVFEPPTYLPAFTVFPPRPEISVIETPSSPATEASEPPSRALSPDIELAPSPADEEALDALTASLGALFVDPDADLNDVTASLAVLSLTSNADNENSDMADAVPSPSSSITSVMGAGHQGYCTSFTSSTIQYTQPSSTGSTDASSGFVQQPSSSVSTPPSSSGSTEAVHPASLPEEDSTMDGVEASKATGDEDSDMGGGPSIADTLDARDCVVSAADGITGTQVPADSAVVDPVATNDDHEMEDIPAPSNGQDGSQTGCSPTAQASSAAPTNITTGEPSETRSPFASIPPTITYARNNHLTPTTPAYTPVGPRVSIPSQSSYNMASSSPFVMPSQNTASQTPSGASGPANPTSAAPLYNPFNRLPSSLTQPSTTTAASPSQAPPHRPGMTPVPFSLRALRTPGAVIAPILAAPAIPGLRPLAPRNTLYNSASASAPALNPQAPAPTTQTTPRQPASATTPHNAIVRGSVRLNMSQPDGINNTPQKIAERERRAVASRVPRAGASVLTPAAPAIVPGAEEAERRRREESEESEEL